MRQVLIPVVAFGAGLLAAHALRPRHTCSICSASWRAESVAHCHRCGTVACRRCMKRAVDVHELPFAVIESATCSRCVPLSRAAMQRYQEAVVDIEAIAIFPVDYEELVPPSGMNRDGLPHSLHIQTNWYSQREDAVRELKLIARFNLLEMVRAFEIVRRIEGATVLWCARGEAQVTATYRVLKPGINY